MKAAVIHRMGDVPRYEDFPDPVPGPEELLIRVRAVALENVDKAVADGTHFASAQFMSQLPAIAGFDGIGELSDGRLVGFGGMKPPYGSMAELAVVPQGYTAPIPVGVDPVVAAALPAAALTSLFPLKYGAKITPGETVLVNGATGVSGRLAIQTARLLGAGRVVGTGRNPASLAQVRVLGADAVIDLSQPDDQVAEAFRREAGEGYDIILDFLWGRPTEILLETLIPQKFAFAARKVRLVQIGEKAGDTLALKASSIRTTGLEIIGGGANLTPEALGEGTTLVWAWIQEERLKMEIEVFPLSEIATAWKQTDFQGKRPVIVP